MKKAILLLTTALCVSAPQIVAPLAVAAPRTTNTVPATEAPEVTAVRLRDAALEKNAAYDFVAELTTRFGARPAGSVAERRAAEWSAGELKKMGFDNVRVERFPLQIWARGAEKLEIVGPFAQTMVVTALGGSAATPPEGIEAEAAIFHTYQEFLDDKTDLKGKIVVILQPTVRTQTGQGYGVNSGPIRSRGPQAARDRGAVGFVMRSLGTEDHRFAHTGATRYLGEQGIPSLAMSPPDAEQFERLLKMQRAGKAGPLRLRMLSTPTFKGAGQSQNVIAEIRGSKRPQEIITIGGHLDSWDLGTGAIDDGAGVAITMAAARLMIDQGLRPERTVRVIFWGAEEVSQPGDQGLSGANAYAAASANDTHIAAAESDFGADVIYSLALPNGNDPDFNRKLGVVLSPLGIYIERTSSTGGGPDTSPLNARGVPIFDLQQNGTDYFDVHHTADDTLDRINPTKMTQNVAAWAATVWMIANTDVRFQPTNGK